MDRWMGAVVNIHAVEISVCLFLTCRHEQYTRAENDIVARLVELAGSYTHTSKK